MNFDLSFAATDAECARGFDRNRPRSNNNAGAFELPSRRENKSCLEAGLHDGISLRATTASTALVAMPYVRGAHAAGKLTVGLWDHWVPTANAASTALIEEWAAKEKVEVQIDYITTQGNKLLLTEHAEAHREAATTS